ncbi:MAG: hypothetical protein WBW34_11190, partial [Nitrososphaeraceae archaeon]
PPTPTPDTEAGVELKTYYHLIETQYLPHIGQYYSCKEHPDIWDTTLKGMEESHFKPYHR